MTRLTRIRTFVQKWREKLSFLTDDELDTFASGLSFYTIFSLIPLLMVLIWAATAVPMADDYVIKVKHFFLVNLVPSSQSAVTSQIDKFLENSFKLGLVGIASALYTTWMFVRNYDFVVQRLFGANPRTIAQLAKTYLIIFAISPIMLGLLVVSAGLIQKLMGGGKIPWLTAILPFLSSWIVFYIAYRLSPNQRVGFVPPMVSAFFASAAWYALKLFFVVYTLYNKSYMTIYGSFSTILLFLLWVYLSWYIYLVGMLLCKKMAETQLVKL